MGRERAARRAAESSEKANASRLEARLASVTAERRRLAAEVKLYGDGEEAARAELRSAGDETLRLEDVAQRAEAAAAEREREMHAVKQAARRDTEAGAVSDG